MRLRPIKTCAHAPAVDDVAHQEDGVGVVVTQEIENDLRLAAARAQMQIGDEESAIAPGGRNGGLVFALAGHGGGSV